MTEDRVPETDSAMSAASPLFVTSDDLRRVLDFPAAALALRNALERGFNPAADHVRRSEELERGAMLLMPSENGLSAGIKVLTMAPENPARGLDLIQGAYLLFDGTTLALTHIIDGAALTDLRTPATSMMALMPGLDRFSRPLRAVVFGAGHQGRAHARALHQMVGERPGLESVVAVVRRPEAVDTAGDFTDVVGIDGPEVERELAEADVVLCATPSTAPLFDSALLRDDVVVAAVGSHTPQARELDARLMQRAEVVVEDRNTALRECGDAVMAIEEGMLTERELVPVADVITGRHIVDRARPYVFKGSGMPWQDLVVAEAYARRAERER